MDASHEPTRSQKDVKIRKCTDINEGLCNWPISRSRQSNIGARGPPLLICKSVKCARPHVRGSGSGGKSTWYVEPTTWTFPSKTLNPVEALVCSNGVVIKSILLKSGQRDKGDKNSVDWMEKGKTYGRVEQGRHVPSPSRLMSLAPPPP